MVWGVAMLEKPTQAWPVIITVFQRFGSQGRRTLLVYRDAEATHKNEMEGTNYAEYYLLTSSPDLLHFRFSRLCFYYDPATDMHMGFYHVKRTKNGRDYMMVSCLCLHGHVMTYNSKSIVRRRVPEQTVVDSDWIDGVLCDVGDAEPNTDLFKPIRLHDSDAESARST